jgi:cyclophilin family peptidyl-prolyl cis-trans isomerase
VLKPHKMFARIFKVIASCSIALLTACGGSSPGPSVFSIAADPLSYGQPSLFTFVGEMLEKGVSVSAQGCSGLVQAAGSTSSNQVWSCTVDAVGTEVVRLQAKATSGTVLKEQAFDVPVPTSPVVMSIQSDRLMYSKSTVFTLAGQSLDKDFSVSIKGCKGLALVAGGSATAQSVTCAVNAVGTGAVGLEAKLANGKVLKSKVFDVLAPQVTLTTNLGTMVVELNSIAAPKTVDNFLQYVADKFYDNTMFHGIYAVVISVIQGGWLNTTPAIQPGQRAAIPLEVGKGLSNVRGTIAMARQSALDSATSQFFFNVIDNRQLDTANGGYAVFGKVVSGLETMDAIFKVPTATQYGVPDFPTSNVIVQSAIQTQ